MKDDEDRPEFIRAPTEKEAKHTPPTMKAQPTSAGPGGMGPGGSFQSRKVWAATQGRAYAEGVRTAEAEPPKAKEPPRMTVQQRGEDAKFPTTRAEYAANWSPGRDERGKHIAKEVSPVLAAALKNATPEQQRLAGFMAESQARQRATDADRPFARMGGAIL